MSNIEKIKKYAPIIYQLYDYLKTNATGVENRKSGKEIMLALEIERDDKLRSYIREIRDSDIFQKPICSASSHNHGYWIATDTEELLSNLKQQEARYWDGLIRVKKQIKKAKLHNQRRFRLFGKEKEIWESVEKNPLHKQWKSQH